MKKMLFVLIVTLVAHVVYGQEIKKMNIKDLEEYIRKSEKPLVVNFWATFCQPCIEEIPYFQNTIKEKYKNDVELLLVSLDLPDYYPAKISSFVNRKNFFVPVIWLNESDADYFCPIIDARWSGAIPATLMINNKKKYRKFFEQQLTHFQLERELKGLAE